MNEKEFQELIELLMINGLTRAEALKTLMTPDIPKEEWYDKFKKQTQ